MITSAFINDICKVIWVRPDPIVKSKRIARIYALTSQVPENIVHESKVSGVFRDRVNKIRYFFDGQYFKQITT